MNILLVSNRLIFFLYSSLLGTRSSAGVVAGDERLRSGDQLRAALELHRCRQTQTHHTLATQRPAAHHTGDTTHTHTHTAAFMNLLKTFWSKCTVRFFLICSIDLEFHLSWSPFKLTIQAEKNLEIEIFFWPNLKTSSGPGGGERLPSEDQQPGPGGFWDVPVCG